MKLENLNNADNKEFVISASQSDPTFKASFEENTLISCVMIKPRYGKAFIRAI